MLECVIRGAIPTNGSNTKVFGFLGRYAELALLCKNMDIKVLKILNFQSPITLKVESFAGRNFRDFANFDCLFDD